MAYLPPGQRGGFSLDICSRWWRIAARESRSLFLNRHANECSFAPFPDRAGSDKRRSPPMTILEKIRIARCLALLLFFGAGLGARGQSTSATLSGVVHDPTGAVLPQVKITLKNIAKGTSRTTLTDSEGRYNLASMEPGSYELRAEASGFRTEIKSGVVLSVGGSSQIDLALRVGTASEVITVTDQAPLIETSKAEVSNVVSEQAIQSLPNIGRNFVD